MLLVIVGVAVGAPARASVSDLSSSVAGSSGGRVTGGSLTLGLTIGQAVVGHAVPLDGTFAETAGFWRWGHPTVLHAAPHVPHALPALSLAPNPSSSGTTIRLSLPSSTGSRQVRVSIVDVGGRLVHELADGPMNPGTHTLTWNGLDRSGIAAAPGLYFCRAAADDFTLSRRLAVIR